MSKTYIIISKPGMTPFAKTTSKREANKLSRQARKLGLSGEIVTR